MPSIYIVSGDLISPHAFLMQFDGGPYIIEVTLESAKKPAEVAAKPSKKAKAANVLSDARDLRERRLRAVEAFTQSQPV